MALAQGDVVAGARSELVEKVLREECFTATPTTVRGYRTVIGKFLYHTGKLGEFSAFDLKDYFRAELEAGQTRAYCRWQFNALKALFRNLGEEMPVQRRIVPPPLPWEVNAPALEPLDVQALIQAAHKGKLDGPDQALLAASTVWGFRRAELATLSVSLGLVQVAAAKTGVQRIHQLPERLWPALQGYQPMSLDKTATRFKVICLQAGVKKTKWMGWHAIRRAVATALWEAGIDEPSLETYMGWSTSSGRTSSKYYRGRPADLDRRVYDRHPYLAMW